MRAMLSVRFVVVGAALCAAVACGGSARVDSGPGAAGASAAGASSGGPGLAQGGQAPGDAEPISAGSPGMPSGGAGAGGGGAAGVGGQAGGGHGGDWCMLGGVQYSSTPTKCDCNTCWCNSDGSVASTLIACQPPGCFYAGQSYALGVTFPARDGCNTCACQGHPPETCTQLACTCNPDKEWYRKYTATSAATCAAAKFTCPDYTTPFVNDCGCGCEESAVCGQYVDCQPGPNGVDCETLKRACPFAQVTE